VTTERDASLAHLDHLIARGRQLVDSPGPAGALGEWQQHCAAVISRLSGDRKAHWLARAFSDALLVRAPGGEALPEASLDQIVARVVAVLERARQSLRDLETTAPSPDASFPIRRFDFVHSVELRPVLERAYLDARTAFEQGRFGDALMISSGILETLVTDALEHATAEHGGVLGASEAQVTAWPFETRLDVARRVGLIGGGCVRLPEAARAHRQLADSNGELRPGVIISDRDARVTMQVLNVVIRDLDPGR
jgi:hypothetical protein